MKKLNFKEILVPTVSLLLICMIITAALSLTNSFTADKIAQNEELSKQASMQKVCPLSESFETVIENVMYIGLDSESNPIGYAISTSMNGYGGQVKVMTGISVDGTIIGVDVFYNDDETPGLGKNTSNDSFTGQYAGLAADGNIAVSKDRRDGQTVDAVTSATISSRAVTEAVNKACLIYIENIDPAKEGE